MFEYMKVTAETIDTVIKPFSAVAEHGVLVSAGYGTGRGEWNTMTAAWMLMGYLWNRPMAALFIRPQRHTAVFAEEEDYLSVSFLDTADEKMCEALKICGTISGKDKDKAECAGITPVFHDNTVIGFEQALLTLSCRKLYRGQFDSDLFLDPQVIIDCYPEKDFHYVYLCEIRDAYIRI